MPTQSTPKNHLIRGRDEDPVQMTRRLSHDYLYVYRYIGGREATRKQGFCACVASSPLFFQFARGVYNLETGLVEYILIRGSRSWRKQFFRLILFRIIKERQKRQHDV